MSRTDDPNTEEGACPAAGCNDPAAATPPFKLLELVLWAAGGG